MTDGLIESKLLMVSCYSNSTDNTLEKQNK